MKKLLLTLVCASAAAAPVFADELPYKQTFDSKEAFETLTLWDSPDADNTRSWDYSSGAARFYPKDRYSSYDSWFFLPELNLEAGVQYVVTFDTKISSSTSSLNYKDLSLNIGSEANGNAQTELWRENIKSSTYAGKKVAVTVDASGAYILGFRANASSGSINDILVDNIEVTAYMELPGTVTDATATPGDKGALEVILKWTNPAVNDGGATLKDLTGVKIYRTNSVFGSMNDDTLIATVTEGVAPGTESTYTDTEVPASGSYYYYIVPFNANGDCPLTVSYVKTAYVGHDTGLSSTKNVVAAPVPENEKAISVTWDAPTGTNGGYVDPLAITWKITRKGPATVVLEEAWSGELPYNYVDNSIDGLGAYSYTIQYVTADKTESTGATSNTIVAGGSASLPYQETFTSTNALALFTNFAGENSSSKTTWSKSSYSGNYAQLAQTSGTMDSWLVTPPFELKSGTYYDLTFNISASANSSKNFEVMLGKGTAADMLTTSLFDEKLSLTANETTKTVRFKAETDGRHYIGFHAKGAASSGFIRLGTIKLSEVIVAPEPATNLSATADIDGALVVTLKWTNPSADVLGNPLEGITKLEVLRGQDIIKTYDNATPGVEMTLSDEVSAPGKYTYTVVAYLGENAGEASTITSGKVGGVLTLPYTANFSSADGLIEWTLPECSNGKAWSYESTYSRLKSPSSDNSWVFTPEFKACQGEVTLYLSGAKYSSYTNETVNVALYKAADINAEAQCEPVSYTYTSTSYTSQPFALKVPEDGVYVIGICRPTDNYYLYINGASIEQTKNAAGPSAVTDLAVSLDADDEYLLHVEWTNPSTTMGGAPLEEITKIEVKRGDEIVATLEENLVPGEASSFSEKLTEPGLYTYSVTVYSGENASETVTINSPFVGGAFALPYECVIASADDVKLWSLPLNSKDKAWKFESSSNANHTGLVGGNNDISAFTAPLKAQKGTISVSVNAFCYSSRYTENLKVGLFTEPNVEGTQVGEWQDMEITAANYSDVKTAEFVIPETGKYYVALYLESCSMYCYLNSLKVEQTTVDEAIEDIIVYWNNAQARYGIPTVEVNGTDIVMTPYVEPAAVALYEEASEGEVVTAPDQLLDIHLYYASIPGDASQVIFKDSAEGSLTEPCVVENPKHLWVYSPSASMEFDEDSVTGVDEIAADSAAAPARYFNLQGIEVANPVAGKVYIVVKGSKTTKEIVK